MRFFSTQNQPWEAFTQILLTSNCHTQVYHLTPEFIKTYLRMFDIARQTDVKRESGDNLHNQRRIKWQRGKRSRSTALWKALSIDVTPQKVCKLWAQDEKVAKYISHFLARLEGSKFMAKKKSLSCHIAPVWHLISCLMSLCAPSSTTSFYAFVLWCICRCAHYHPLPALMQGVKDVTTLYTMK